MLSKLKDHIGKVAVLIEKDNTVLAKDLIGILSGNNIETEIIEITNNITDLINISKWQGCSRVLLALPPEHYLAYGHIQGLLDSLGLNYTGSGMLASALSSDVVKSKKIWQAMGIATMPFVKWRPNINWQEIIELFGFPLAVRSALAYDQKIFKACNIDQLQEIYKNFNNLNEIIIEPHITGDRYVVYIVNDRVLLDQTLLSDLEQAEVANIVKNMQKLAMGAFTAIGGQGIGSVELIKDLNNDCWVQAVNTTLTISTDSNLSKVTSNHNITRNILIEEILATSFIKKSCNNPYFQKIKIGDGMRTGEI